MTTVKFFYHAENGLMPEKKFLAICNKASVTDQFNQRLISHGRVYIIAINAGYEYRNDRNFSLKCHIKMANPNATVI